MKNSKTSNGQQAAVLISHPTGNQNVRNAVRSLAEHEMLAEFWTTIVWDKESALSWIVPERIVAQLARRSFEGIAPERIHAHPWRESVRLALRSTRLNKLLASRERPFSVIGVYREFDKAVARRLRHVRPDAVYAYEGGALQTFREAKRLGIKTIYEQPSSYWYWNQRLVIEEAERSPEFANQLTVFIDPEKHLKWKDEEIALADEVIVPSEHVKKTLKGVVPDSRITVISYGAPKVRELKADFSSRENPLRAIYVGALHQRKGIGYFLKALDLVDFPIDVTFVGRRVAENPSVDAACRRFRWFESLPHEEVLKLMANADVLVHPSPSEGCALVVLEALSAGLPVIVTPNSGTLEFVQDGKQGFVVPVCNADAIAGKLRLLNADRTLLAKMSAQAQVTARERSWAYYRSQWANAVRDIVCQS
ncbi:MAG: glycosyltransferase family 4 protein [Terracidiphilus sp.]|nr:glycosyltransferase family 4 protein [Terracidiphilus sp.]